MRFNRISITNMRLVGENTIELNIDSAKNVLILLGNNGFGKTTILDAMATAMAPYSAQFPGITDYQLSNLDVHINRQGQLAKYLAINAELSDGDDIVMTSVRYRKGTENAPKTNYEQLKQAAIGKKNAILAGETNVELPIFAYYGTGRGQFQVPERRRGFQQSFERWDCYKSAINPETDFKRFFGWFDLMEDEERRTKEKLRDFDYKLPVLNAVRNALSRTIKSYKNPRIETIPLRFVMDRIDEGSCHELRIEQLSEGYKIVIAMVADLAARMAEANPNMADPLISTGIVLIDEVDLHLHPHWQRDILTQLTSVFPKIQFIVSTHSPVIVVGAAEIAQIINLNKIGIENDLSQENIQISNVGQVLLSDLFGLTYLQSPAWDEKINQRDRLLAKPELTEEDKTKLKQLDEEMKGLTSVQDSNAIRSTQLLEKLAKQLNIEL